MTAAKISLFAIALLLGGWLGCDGTRALITGDYLTARTGPHAGKLGPWAQVVSALGLPPRGTLMKTVHVALGLCWLWSPVVFLVRPATGWWALLLCSVGSLWYLPIGTVLSLIEIALLLTPTLRALR